MPSFAPRIDSKLIAALRVLDDERLPIAETNRRVGELAVHVGLPRPSYEQVRTLVHALRAAGPPPGAALGELLLDIAFRVRPPIALADILAGIEPPRMGK
jgi:hypothetical protein